MFLTFTVILVTVLSYISSNFVLSFKSTMSDNCYHTIVLYRQDTRIDVVCNMRKRVLLYTFICDSCLCVTFNLSMRFVLQLL